MTAARDPGGIYRLAVIFSMLFALVGFSYNVWRMEVSERNNNTRTACFELLLTLASLEQLVYRAHYDQDPVEGNPRKGWVQVGLIVDLSAMTTPDVEAAARELHASWSQHWQTLPTERSAADAIVVRIDDVRGRIKQVLATLE